MTNNITVVILWLISMSPVLVTAEVASEQALKSLFTSPAERQEINASRRGVTSSSEVIGPTSVQIQGIVKRSDGRSVVWLNGKNTMDNNMVDGVKVYPDSMNKNNKIGVMVDGEMVYVKPGESWSEETGVDRKF